MPSLDVMLSHMCSLTDIERTYGERKPLAARMPMQNKTVPRSAPAAPSLDDDLTSTPALTDASAESDTETDDASYQEDRSRQRRSSSTGSVPQFKSPAQDTTTRHDLDNKYFHHDLLVFKNFDVFR